MAKDFGKHSDTPRDQAIPGSRPIESRSRLATRAAVAVLAVAAAAIVPLTVTLIGTRAIRAENDGGDITFTVDVSQSKKTNVQNNVNPGESPDAFSRGDTFVVNGPVYPGGTIPRDIADPPPNAHAIGTYRLRGAFLRGTDAFARAVAGDPSAPELIAFATESYSFPDDGATILLDGVWPNAHRSVHRVVLGGTGRFRNVVGEAEEEEIGENTEGFCNLRITFRLRKVSGGHNE